MYMYVPGYITAFYIRDNEIVFNRVYIIYGYNMMPFSKTRC